MPDLQQQPQQPVGQAPDAQDSFDKFVINGLKILHTPDVTENIVQRVQSNQDKIEAIGEASLDIVGRLESSADEKGFPVTANTILNGMNVIVGEVINIAESSGMEPLNEEQKYQAFSWTISNYLNNSVESGKISKEELIQIGEQMKQTEAGQAVAQQAGPQQVAPEQAQPPGLLSGGVSWMVF